MHCRTKSEHRAKILHLNLDGSFFKDAVHLSYDGNNKLMELLMKAIRFLPKSAFEVPSIPFSLSDSVQFPKLSSKRPAPEPTYEKFPKFPRMARKCFVPLESPVSLDDRVHHPSLDHPQHNSEPAHHVDVQQVVSQNPGPLPNDVSVQTEAQFTDIAAAIIPATQDGHLVEHVQHLGTGLVSDSDRADQREAAPINHQHDKREAGEELDSSKLRSKIIYLEKEIGEAKQTINRLEKEARIGKLEKEVNILKSSMLSLLSKRGKDRVMMDQLQTHLIAVDEGAETLVSMIEEKLETIESKLIDFKSEDEEKVFEEDAIENVEKPNTREEDSKDVSGDKTSSCSIQ